MLRPHWVCPAQGCLCFPIYTAQAPGCSVWNGPCVECGSSFRVLHNSADSVAPACCVFPASAVQAAKGLCAFSRARRAFSLRGERLRQPEVLAASPRVWRAFSLLGPSTRRQLGLRKSLDRNRGLFAVWEGVAFLGLSLPTSPPPCLLPPAWMGWLFSGVSQSLCFANRRQCVLAG